MTLLSYALLDNETYLPFLRRLWREQILVGNTSVLIAMSENSLFIEVPVIYGISCPWNSVLNTHREMGFSHPMLMPIVKDVSDLLLNLLSNTHYFWHSLEYSTLRLLLTSWHCKRVQMISIISTSLWWMVLTPLRSLHLVSTACLWELLRSQSHTSHWVPTISVHSPSPVKKHGSEEAHGWTKPQSIFESLQTKVKAKPMCFY